MDNKIEIELELLAVAIDIAEAGSNSVLDNVLNLLDIEAAEHNNNND